PIRHLDLCRHFFVQAEDGIRDRNVTGVQTCALPISEQGLKHRLTRSRSDLGYTSVIDSTVRRKAYDRTMSITVMILSGGRSRRFGGVHKPGVSLGGQTVISRILGTVRAAVPDAKVWVAGTLEGLTAAEAESVGNVREEPEFSGPLAGIDAAAQAMGESEVTLILAGDMPLVPAVHLRELIAACRASGLPAAGAD